MTRKTPDSAPEAAPIIPSTGLVIGGGGVAGIAWATGILLGLERAGIHLRRASRLVGTSAGSTVTAQLTSSATLTDLYHRQHRGTVQEIPGGLGAMGMIRLGLPFKLRRDDDAARRSIGAFARGKGAHRGEGRAEVIRARLDGAEWDPGRDLRIAAIHIDTGQRTVFTAEGPASLAQAVAASCAVPGVWPPVTIEGEEYMDGGFPSPANVDLAHGCARVVVLAPLASGLRSTRSPEAELETLRRVHPGSATALITPGEDAQKAMGTNPLDPHARTRAAEAGLAQAKAELGKLAHVWPSAP